MNTARRMWKAVIVTPVIALPFLAVFLITLPDINSILELIESDTVYAQDISLQLISMGEAYLIDDQNGTLFPKATIYHNKEGLEDEIIIVGPLAENSENRGQVHLSATLNLPVVEIREEFLPYKNFCQRNPEECDLSGPLVIELTEETLKVLNWVNETVNAEIQFCLDKDLYCKEEFWALPGSRRGDCEDVALEKRRRLTKLGIPRGALRIAIGCHKKKLASHALLLVETTQGTYVLNGINDHIVLWHQSPYNFESRERPDGRWERFGQCFWTFD